MTLRTVVSDYHSQSAAIRVVRNDVFLREQAIPPELEQDDRDAICWHAVIYDGETPIATGRLDVEQDGRIGRVAVLETHRRRGLGTLVMEALAEKAQAENLPKLWFHAQRSAVPFYLSLGYRAVGDEYLEAGIPHLTMEKIFASR
jgi:predicted GNAT family N-acyltransferase